MVSEGKFRADLYYRINVIQLHIPPLRERKEDIPYLSNHFIEEFNKKMNKEIYSISADALAILKEYDWPGNIRELENILERAFHFCKGNQIKSEDILLDAIDHLQLNRGETQPKVSTSNNDLSNRKK